MSVINFENENRKFIDSAGSFKVLEYQKDASVTSVNAQTEYFMSKMNVKRRQLVYTLDGKNSLVMQAGAMQWTLGNISISTGVKGAGDFMSKMFKGSVTGESAVKPEYKGTGTVVFEPTYKHIILQDVSTWGKGMVVEDGMFLACDGTVKQSIVARKNVSSAALGGEGLFNLALSGQGIVALESRVPMVELVEVQLNGEELKIDGNFAVCWSAELDFTVEKATKSLIGSTASGEGLVNVYRGIGKVLMSPVSYT